MTGVIYLKRSQTRLSIKAFATPTASVFKDAYIMRLKSIANTKPSAMHVSQKFIASNYKILPAEGGKVAV